MKFRKEKEWKLIRKADLLHPDGETLEEYSKIIDAYFPEKKEGDKITLSTNYWGYDGGKDIYANLLRLETDEEYEIEKAKFLEMVKEREEKYKKQQEKSKIEEKERELKELARLKNKYESHSKK